MTLVLTFTLCLAATVGAQPLVVSGTGDPTVDVAAVQAAVDQGGQIVLKGHFSFDAPPSKPAGESYNRTVTISKSVSIWGAPDANGGLTTIEGGFIPFFVAASGQPVAIQSLRFVRPKGIAIWVSAASGLGIAYCRVEGVDPSVEYGSYAGQPGTLASAIFVATDPNPPSATHLGTPENVSGTLSILNNDIDVGGTTADRTLGIVVFNAGKSPDKEVDLYISGNNVRNITERVINVNSIGGRVHVERNVITTGAVFAPTSGLQPNGMNLVGAGSFLIAHNSIVSEWGAGSGILVQGNPGFSEAGAVVVDNEVTMSAAESTVFGSTSAGIMVTGFAQGNSVVNNRIRGRARAALAVAAKSAGLPGNSTFISNDLAGFQSSLADLYVDAGITNTVVVGTIGKVEDQGAGTIIVPMSDGH